MFDTSNLKCELESALYLVPTPIGNLEDITFRAMRVLATVDMVACEDTRTTASLLKKIGVHATQLTSYHEYNEREKAPYLADLIKQGKSVALVSDAGTPALSDPGYRLINSTIELGLKIIALPGANALLPALSSSGFPTNEFIFMGFPPQKKGRQTFLKRVSEQETTVIIYESTHRIIKLVSELGEHCGDERQICIAREISKIYEEYLRGTIGELKITLAQRKELKGEIVVVIARKESAAKEESVNKYSNKISVDEEE